MGQARFVIACVASGALIALGAMSLGCSGATSRPGASLELRKSGTVTSCGTGRASEPGVLDTIDVGWLRAPLRVLSYADPVYPEEALRAGQEGRVEARVLITPEGTVGKVLNVAGPEVFREAATVAMRGAELSPPTELYGRPAMVCATLVVTFQAVQGGVAWLQISSE